MSGERDIQPNNSSVDSEKFQEALDWLSNALQIMPIWQEYRTILIPVREELIRCLRLIEEVHASQVAHQSFQLPPLTEYRDTHAPPKELLCPTCGQQTHIEISQEQCPVCKGAMKIKHNSKAGKPFLGCIQFPQCRGTVDMTKLLLDRAARVQTGVEFGETRRIEL